MNYNDLVNLFKRSEYKTAITKNLPPEVLTTVFNRSLEQGINPFLPIFQIAVETSGKPKLHIKNDNSYNWFNITAVGKQKFVTYPVTEYDRKGKKFTKMVNFRIFNSLEDAIDEFINLIKKSYPNYNDVNYKSLINKNGAAYASADYNGKSYTQMVIDVAKQNFQKLGIQDYSITNLRKIFNNGKNIKSSFPTLNVKKSMRIDNINKVEKKISKAATTLKPNVTSNLNNNIKNSELINLGETVIKKKRKVRDYSVSASKGYDVEFIPNGVYITYNGRTILMINSTSTSFDNFVKLIVKGVKNEANWENKTN